MTEIVNHLSSILDKSSTKENICDENLAYIHDKVEDFTNQILQKKKKEGKMHLDDSFGALLIFFFRENNTYQGESINT